MNATHSQGPWEVTLGRDQWSAWPGQGRIGDAVFGATVRESHTKDRHKTSGIAVMWEHSLGEAVANANARLIAAAPDLLAACRYTLTELENTLLVMRLDPPMRGMDAARRHERMRSDLEAWRDTVAAAIAKATGATEAVSR